MGQHVCILWCLHGSFGTRGWEDFCGSVSCLGSHSWQQWDLTWSTLAVPFHAAVRQPAVHANCPTVITTSTSLGDLWDHSIHSEAFFLLKWLQMVAAWLRCSWCKQGGRKWGLFNYAHVDWVPILFISSTGKSKHEHVEACIMFLLIITKAREAEIAHFTPSLTTATFIPS